jgi:hypothetical protein
MGERGEPWRRFLVVAVCLLAVLIWLAIRQLASWRSRRAGVAGSLRTDAPSSPRP